MYGKFIHKLYTITDSVGGHPVSSKEMQAKMDLKADKLETENLWKNKASREEYTNSIQSKQNVFTISIIILQL